MRWWSELKFIIRKLNRRRAEREMDEEIQTHLELDAEEEIADRRSPQDASHAAHRAFGNVLISKENTRSIWGFDRLESWWKDVRYSGKALSRSPGYTSAAVITLALGIGVNSTIYSGINAILFRPLAGVLNPEQLCRINLPYQPANLFFTKIIVRNRSAQTQITQFFQELQRRTMVLPDVKSVAVGEAPLLEGQMARYVIRPEGT